MQVQIARQAAHEVALVSRVLKGQVDGEKEDVYVRQRCEQVRARAVVAVVAVDSLQIATSICIKHTIKKRAHDCDTRRVKGCLSCTIHCHLQERLELEHQ